KRIKKNFLRETMFRFYLVNKNAPLETTRTAARPQAKAAAIPVISDKKGGWANGCEFRVLAVSGRTSGGHQEYIPPGAGGGDGPGGPASGRRTVQYHLPCDLRRGRGAGGAAAGAGGAPPYHGL